MVKLLFLLSLPIATIHLHAKEPDTLSNEEQCIITEDVVEEASINLDETNSNARAVPYFEHGKVIGLRYFAIKRGSFWDIIGIRNGDILKSFVENDILESKITDIRQPLTLLHKYGELSLEILRANTLYKIKYRVQKSPIKDPQCAFIQQPRFDPALALTRNPMREEITLRNVSTEKALEFLSKQSGKEFSKLPNLKGRVTLSVSTLSSEEAGKLLDTVLLVHGYSSAKEKDGKWIANEMGTDSHAFGTLSPVSVRVALKDGGFLEMLFSEIVLK